MATGLTEILKTDLVHKRDLMRTSKGDLDTISGLENVRMALFHRLITVPGSLIHRPDYGVGLPLFQNAADSISTQREIALRIQEQFARDPRVVEVLGIGVQRDDNQPGLIKLTVRAKIVGYDEAQAMIFTASTEGV